MYYVDRILRGTKKVVNNGFYEVYVNAQIDDGNDLAELMKIFKSANVPENSKFPRICSSIKNLKVWKGRDIMCALVEEYAEKKAKAAVVEAEKKIKEAEKKAKREAEETASNLLKIGKLTVEEIASSIPLLSIEKVMRLQQLL